MEKEYTSLIDIEYGKHERQKLDIFIPKNVKCNTGIILFIHGGGWTQGDKSGHHHDTDYFCHFGYICASMNYRYVSEKINVFDELNDISSALNTIKTECIKYGFNIEKAILSGGSAGSHLSLMYAYTRQDESPVQIVAACVYCPPVDCSKADFLLGISGEFEEWKYQVLSKCCGFSITKDTLLEKEQQQALKSISPETYISSRCVPTAVFHGRIDELIPIEHIHKFLFKLDKYGIQNDIIIYENSGHGLDKNPEAASAAREIFNNYAQTYLT